MAFQSDYSSQIQPHQQQEWRQNLQNSQTSSVALLSVGNELFNRDQIGDAMSMFDAAHVALRSPVNASAIVQQLQWGRSQLGQQPLSSKHLYMQRGPYSADTYLEDECDVGPFPLLAPLLPDPCVDFYYASSGRNVTVTQITEAFILYNKGLVLHSRFDFLEAMGLYEAAAKIINAVTTKQSNGTLADSIHPKLAVLGMSVQNNMGQIAYIEGAEDVAMSHFEASIGFVNKFGHVSDEGIRLDTATAISNWCRIHWMRGDLNEHVYKELNEVLSIRSSMLGSEHIMVASAHYNLGVAEYTRRRNEEAICHLMQYLKVAAQHAKTTMESELDPIPALVYILLIKNEDRQEEDHFAQELVSGLRALQEKRSDLGPRDANVASVLNYVGTILFHQRDFDHALLFFQEELRLEECLKQGTRDVSVSVTCNNIGRILQEQHRLPEAIRFYSRALQSEYGDEVLKMAIKSKEGSTVVESATLTAKSELLALPRATLNLYSTIWYNLGLIYDRLGSFGEAIKSFKMSLALRRSMFGHDSADVACLMYNIAILQMEQQLLNDATNSFREALRIRKVAATGQLNDFHVVKTLQKLATLHKSKGNIEGAVEAYQEILLIQESSSAFDEMSRKKEMGTTLREVSELYYAGGDIEMALVKSRESVFFLRELHGQLPPSSSNYVAYVEELFASLLLHGSLYHEKSEANQARYLFTEASSIVKRASLHFLGPTGLDALREVSQMLATCHCSPQA
mgnify:CR=1 FL=1